MQQWLLQSINVAVSTLLYFLSLHCTHVAFVKCLLKKLDDDDDDTVHIAFCLDYG